ncbi:unnamed protein product [Sphagnum troendelagicum]
MHRESGLVSPVSHQFFPRLPSWGKANSFASRASDYVLGSMIPRPPLEIGRESMSHFTLALADVALPPQMKFRTTPHTWLHILGLGFQHAVRYHMDVSRTCLATRILPARDRLLWL